MQYEFVARDSTGIANDAKRRTAVRHGSCAIAGDLTVIVPHSREIGAVLRGRYRVGVSGSGLVQFPAQ